MFDFILVLAAVAANAASETAPSTDTAQNPAPSVQEAPAVAAAEQKPDPAPAQTPSVVIGEGTTIGQGVIIGGAALLDGTSDNADQPTDAAPATPTGPAINQAVIPAGLAAEPQTPSGKFTTAAEVKPILDATKASWVAVREYDGKDLLYVTHLWSWRCGLAAMAISVNDEPMQNWPLPPCHMKYTTPNAILEEDGLPYLSLRLGAVETITIQVVYDDLSVDVARFERGNVLIP